MGRTKKNITNTKPYNTTKREIELRRLILNSILFVVSVNSFWVDGQHKNLDRANIFLNSTNFFQVFFLLLLVSKGKCSICWKPSLSHSWLDPGHEYPMFPSVMLEGQLNSIHFNIHLFLRWNQNLASYHLRQKSWSAHSWEKRILCYIYRMMLS